MPQTQRCQYFRVRVPVCDRVRVVLSEGHLSSRVMKQIGYEVDLEMVGFSSSSSSSPVRPVALIELSGRGAT
jgi:hypothetical protein